MIAINEKDEEQKKLDGSLRIAVRKADKNKVRELLEKGASANTRAVRALFSLVAVVLLLCKSHKKINQACLCFYSLLETIISIFAKT